VSVTDELVFKLGDTGTELNTDVSLPFVDILRVYGLDSAPIRETERDHEGVDGGFMDAEFEKGRPMMMDGEAFATAATLEDYLDQLKYEWSPSTVAVPFYLRAPGQQDRVIFVKPRGLRYDWAGDRRRGVVRVQFVMYAEDPRIYDAVEQDINIAYGGEAGIGFAFDFEFDLDFGGGAEPAGQYIDNAGNRPTPAILTIAGPIINPLIANDTNGGLLSFEINLGASDVLVIDLAAKTVLLNGTTNRRATLVQPDWFLLDPGLNFIRFGGTDGTGSQLTVSYRNAWR